MSVIHIFADGSRSDTLDGRIVRQAENTEVYQVMNRINRRLNNERRKTNPRVSQN